MKRDLEGSGGSDDEEDENPPPLPPKRKKGSFFSRWSFKKPKDSPPLPPRNTTDLGPPLPPRETEEEEEEEDSKLRVIEFLPPDRFVLPERQREILEGDIVSEEEEREIREAVVKSYFSQEAAKQLRDLDKSPPQPPERLHRDDENRIFVDNGWNGRSDSDHLKYLHATHAFLKKKEEEIEAMKLLEKEKKEAALEVGAEKRKRGLSFWVVVAVFALFCVGVGSVVFGFQMEMTSRRIGSASTSNPTSSPTFSPSFFPTTLSPSTSPSFSPTTLQPSVSPTSFPTTRNPIGPLPTSFPTTPFPTSFPTASPSFPTSFPTKAPTESPTPFPSFFPSSFPTISPTSFPSSLPTSLLTSDDV